MSYKSFFTTRHYSYPELLKQVAKIKQHYPQTVGQCKRGKVDLTLKLKPTSTSIVYTIKLFAKQDSTVVNIFVVNPPLG